MSNVTFAGDEDTDSLFGSPPPSPGRGRSPSLALPGTGNENVGTIALPGSHDLFSELPVTSPVSLTQSHGERAQVRSVPPPARRVTPAKPKPKPKAHSVPPRPEGPQVAIPGPDEQVPANFLRNSQALLGLAGVVAGVNPRNLQTKLRPGASAENPIILDEATAASSGTPSISTASWRRAHRLPVRAEQLPPPKPDQILTTLINQKNIIPVLESLLATVSGVAYPSGFNQSHPPPKRKKLNHVPAGAMDWDVPYPFPQSDGPSNYKESWEKERVKRLLKELVDLIREAATKAATKQYLKQKKVSPSTAPGAPSPSEPPESQVAPTPLLNSQQRVLTPVPLNSLQVTPDISNPPHCSPTTNPTFPQQQSNAPPPLQPSQEPESTFGVDFGEWLAALDIDSWGLGDDALSGPPAILPSGSAGFDELYDTAMFGNDVQSSPGVGLFDFDMTTDGFDPAASPVPPLSCMPASVESDTTIWSSSQDVGVVLPASTSPAPSDSPTTDKAEATFPPQSTLIPRTDDILQDILPETTGMGLSWDQMGLSTNLSMDPFAGIARDINAAQNAISSPSPVAAPAVPQSAPDGHPTPSASSSQGTTSFDPYSSILLQALNNPYAGSQLSRESSICRDTSVAGSSKRNRDEILRRAKERRAQLAAELARSKVELWETTVEQGVLANLMKDKDLESMHAS